MAKAERWGALRRSHGHRPDFSLTSGLVMRQLVQFERFSDSNRPAHLDFASVW
jgi:hypothetical protein